MRIALDQNDFQALVNGGVVFVEEDALTVEIILKDIGFKAMEDCIREAIGNDGSRFGEHHLHGQ